MFRTATLTAIAALNLSLAATAAQASPSELRACYQRVNAVCTQMVENGAAMCQQAGHQRCREAHSDGIVLTPGMIDVLLRRDRSGDGILLLPVED